MFRLFGQSKKPKTPVSPPIFDAVLKSDYAGLSALLADGVTVDLHDHHGMTPLLWAVWRGDNQAVELLLEARANPNMPDSDGATPLWYAAEDFGLHEIAQLLRDHGAK